jgi:RHS repeat-associated protein
VTTDALGTPRAIGDDTGTTIWSWQYAANAFGESQPTSNIGYVFNLRTIGEYYDAESGLSYNGARTRDALTGRFIQSDPLGLAGGLSTYAAVESNPLSYVDPDGTQVTGTIDSSSVDWVARSHSNNVFAQELIFGVDIDHVNPPRDDSIQSATSPAEWAIGGGLARGGSAAIRAVSMCRGAAASGLGDLTISEVKAIQSVVDSAQRPLNVVGSAAKGLRRGVGTDLPIGKGIGTKSDIDYLAPPYGLPYFDGLQEYLPSIDPKGGISPGLFNPHEGPSIRFEPGAVPFFMPGN